jgi:phosphatidylserine/phosphatidylglycerophosphate/cardiolipin synthase-like enzyme
VLVFLNQFFIAFVGLLAWTTLVSSNPHFPNLVHPSTHEEIQKNLPKGWSLDGVLVFPEENPKAWCDLIKKSKKTIHMFSYRLSDPEIIKALCDASKRGIKIKILIETNPMKSKNGANVNEIVSDLKKAGIEIYFHPNRFNQNHAKVIVIDQSFGMLCTGNPSKEHFEHLGQHLFDRDFARDFAITVTNRALIAHMLNIFNADIKDERIVATHPQLIIGPDEQRSTILRLINSAKHSIRIYQPSIQDVGIAKALAHAAKSGIKVELVMMPFPFGKKNDPNVPHQKLIVKNGGTLFLNKKLIIHAKVVMIDENDSNNRIMYVGSCNFYTPSLDGTREIGILCDDAASIRKISRFFDKDKQN